MMDIRRRRAGTLVTAVSLAAALSAGSAVAFEPPGEEPDDLFSCSPTAVLGHPGGDGLANAMANSGSSTAWNAHFNSDAVGNC